MGTPLVLGILGVQNTGATEPGVALATILRRRHGREIVIVGIGTYALCPAAALGRIFNEIWLLGDVTELPDRVRERIEEEIGWHPLDFVIPGLDAEVFHVTSFQKVLRDLGVRALVPAEEYVVAVSKPVLGNAGSTLPFEFAETRVVLDRDALKRVGCPIVIKGPVCDSYVVGSFDEAVVAFDRIEAIWGLPAITQEYLEGDEYAICVLAGPKPGMLAGAVAIKKMGITEKGKTWLATTIENGELTDIARVVVRHFNWLGPMEIELRLVPGRGFVVFEINPRFPAWLGWLDDDDYGMGHLFLDLLLGQEPRKLTVPSGRVGIRVNRYVTFPMTTAIQLASTGHVEL